MSEIDIRNPWKKLSSKEVYDNNWISVKEDQVLNPSGNHGIYGVVHFKSFAIGIIPLDEARNTWLIGQYRYPLDVYSWEIPEGGGALNVGPLDSAKRELLEETGITAVKWTKIQESHLSNCTTDELSLIYVATELEFGKADPDEDEQLSLRKLPFEEAYQMVLRGEILDSVSIIGIYRTKIMIDQGLL